MSGVYRIFYLLFFFFLKQGKSYVSGTIINNNEAADARKKPFQEVIVQGKRMVLEMLSNKDNVSLSVCSLYIYMYVCIKCIVFMYIFLCEIMYFRHVCVLL